MSSCSGSKSDIVIDCCSSSDSDGASCSRAELPDGTHACITKRTNPFWLCTDNEPQPRKPSAALQSARRIVDDSDGERSEMTFSCVWGIHAASDASLPNLHFVDEDCAQPEPKQSASRRLSGRRQSATNSEDHAQPQPKQAASRRLSGRRQSAAGRAAPRQTQEGVRGKEHICRVVSFFT